MLGIEGGQGGRVGAAELVKTLGDLGRIRDRDPFGDRWGQHPQRPLSRGLGQLAEPVPAGQGAVLMLVHNDPGHPQRGVVVLPDAGDGVEQLGQPVRAPQFRVGDDDDGAGGGQAVDRQLVQRRGTVIKIRS